MECLLHGHFINIIESIVVPQNCLLCSYDLTNMYTNLAFNELLNAVGKAYANFDSKTKSDIPCPSKDDLVYLLRLVLENNISEFNVKYYKQIIGAVMGEVPSPEICDIRMYEITAEILSQFDKHNNIIFYGRFRDDGFIIYTEMKKKRALQICSDITEVI